MHRFALLLLLVARVSARDAWSVRYDGARPVAVIRAPRDVYAVNRTSRCYAVECGTRVAAPTREWLHPETEPLPPLPHPAIACVRACAALVDLGVWPRCFWSMDETAEACTFGPAATRAPATGRRCLQGRV